MAKYLNGTVRITLEQNGTETVFESGNVSLSATGGQLGVNIVAHYAKKVDTTSCAKIDGYSKEPSAEQKQELLRQQHADTILGVLKAAEESLVQAQMLRAKLEAEAELHKLESRGKIMKAVHDAIQAGLDMEDVTKDMRDDYCGYVSDIADSVYLATDLDSIVNV